MTGLDVETYPGPTVPWQHHLFSPPHDDGADGVELPGDGAPIDAEELRRRRLRGEAAYTAGCLRVFREPGYAS
jgi:hypothetical protein